jgi:hypothetical protein
LNLVSGEKNFELMMSYREKWKFLLFFFSFMGWRVERAARMCIQMDQHVNDPGREREREPRTVYLKEGK